ncbi:MAG: ATP-binding cassette domain-containing protein [Cyanobacteria bacterium J06634_6]
MPQHTHPCLVADNLSYTLASDRTIFAAVSASIFPGDRIALIGNNGVGKSTLFQLFSQQRSPTQGTLTSKASTCYVPQLSSLAASIRHQSVLDFLTTMADTWWEIEHTLKTTFNTTLDLASSVDSLSGGELMQLSLAVALWRSPDLLLLDEPTNHLDYLAQEQLLQGLSQFKGALVVVSHKPLFLDQATDTTWELTPTGLRVFGSSYSRYREQKRLDQAAEMRSHETARKELKRAKATAQSEQKRAAQSNRTGVKHRLTNRVDRAAAGSLKNRAEVTAGNQKSAHEKAVETASQKVAETKVRTLKAMSIQLAARSQKQRTLIDIRDADLWVDERRLLQAVRLKVNSGDRIAIAGPNGSGKSSLVKSIVGTENASARLTGREQQIAAMKTVYLDQTYALVDRSKTILENMHQANPAIEYQLLRQQLGHFLFFNDDVYKSAAALSGGELARCAIALLTSSELDLLILDEPTNNLDIATVNQMVDALNDYSGTLCVISHDLNFLSRIRITHSFRVRQNTLSPTDFLPSESSLYYSELLKAE